MTDAAAGGRWLLRFASADAQREPVTDREAGKSPTGRMPVHEPPRRQGVFEQGIAKYAESFGSEAAERLRSYVQHLARESVRPTWR